MSRQGTGSHSREGENKLTAAKTRSGSPARLLAAAALLVPFSAQGAWVVEPSAEIASGYDDNVRLAPGDLKEDGIITDVTAQARGAQRVGTLRRVAAGRRQLPHVFERR